MITPKKACRVGILRTYDNFLHQAMAFSVYQRLLPDEGRPLVYEPQLYTAHFTPESVAVQFEEMQSAGCNVIVALGHTLTALLSSLYDERQSTFPTICIGGMGLSEVGLIDSYERPGRNRTAIVAHQPQDDIIADEIALLRPYIPRLLLFYVSFGWGDRHHVVAKRLREFGFEVVVHEAVTVQQAVDLVHYYRTIIRGVVALEGVSACVSPDIVKTCADNDLLFFSGSGVQGLQMGATAAYGGDYTALADDILLPLKAFHEHGINLGEVPVQIVKYERYFMANALLLQQVGIPREIVKQMVDSGRVRMVRWVIERSR